MLRRVIVVEDSRDYLASLKTVLSLADGFEFAAGFGSGERFLDAWRDPLERVRLRRCDLMLLDLGLPGIGGLEVLEELQEDPGDMRIIVLTSRDDDAAIRQALARGASSYLVKGTLQQLLKGLELVAEGYEVRPQVTQASTAPSDGPPTNAAPDYGLTQSELEVLACLVAGLQQKEIADRLGKTVHTVRSQLKSIYRRLRVHNAAGAVAKAVGEGLLPS